MCINVASQSAGTQLITLANCSGGTAAPPRPGSRRPPSAPARRQAPQLINYYEFGRCLDVTNQNVNEHHLIDFPCKQNPYPPAVAWNQKFSSNVAPGVVGQLYTNTASTNYCLTSPNTEDGWVVVKPCATTGPDVNAQKWISYAAPAPAVLDQVHDHRLLEPAAVPGPDSRADPDGLVLRRRRDLHRIHRAQVERRSEPVEADVAEHPGALTGAGWPLTTAGAPRWIGLGAPATCWQCG